MVAIEAERRMGASGALFANAPRNLAHALALTGLAAALAAAAGYLIAGLAVAIAVAALVAVYVALLSRLPPNMLMSLYGARAVPQGQAGHILDLVDEIAVTRAGLPHAPQLHVLPSLTLTAFSLGSRTRSAIAVSEGLLRQLTTREIAGVAAHEIAHIRAGDTHVFALADAATRIAQGLALAGAGLVLANLVSVLTGDELVPWPAALVLVLAPAIMSLAGQALSHAREFDADAFAVRMTGDALGLAGAIRRMNSGSGSVVEDLTPPAFARRVPLPSLLRLHPDGEARIARILAAGDTGSLPPLVTSEEPMVLHVGFGPAEMRARFRWPGIWC